MERELNNKDQGFCHRHQLPRTLMTGAFFFTIFVSTVTKNGKKDTLPIG
jgi:hypothetical protein